MKTLFVVIEYNWKSVGGVFSNKKLAQQWIKHAHDVQPNLLWELHDFRENYGISDNDVEREYSKRNSV